MKNHTEFKGLPAEFTMIAIEGNMNSEPFNMGGDSWHTESSNPIHKVRLNNFLISEYPVTQDLWAYVMHSNPSFFKGLSRPVEEVSWFDAVVFCNALNTRCGYESCYFSDPSYKHLLGQNTEGVFELVYEGSVFFKRNTKGYRLPTEAEWEYAARGGKYWENFPFIFSGGNKLEEEGWYRKNCHAETKSVGLKTPNYLGLYDMSGNVWEWCEDVYDKNFYEKCAAQGVVKNPCNQDKGTNRVFRGGSLNSYAEDCYPKNRNYDLPSFHHYDVGFRVVLSNS